MKREPGTITYTSEGFMPELVYRRYLGYRGDEIIMYGVDHRSRTLIEIIADPNITPAATMAMLDKCRHTFPCQVRVSVDLVVLP